MRHKEVFVFCATIFMYVLLSPHILISTGNRNLVNKKVVIVSSYNPFNVCYRPQMLGIIDCLRDKHYIRDDEVVQIYYLRAKTKNINPADISDVADDIVKNIIENFPNLSFVVTVDDIAFNYVGIRLANIGYKVIFSGLNLPLTFYKSRLNNNAEVAGVEEIIRLEKLWDLLDLAALTPKTYYVVTSSCTFMSYTEKALIDTLSNEFNKRGISNIQTISFPDTTSLTDFIQKLQKEEFSVIFITAQRLYDPPTRRLVSMEKIVKIVTSLNMRHLEVVFNLLLSKEYNAAISTSVNFYNMGMLAGNILINFQSGKIKQPEVRLGCNVSRLEALGLFYKIFSNKDIRERIDELY